MAQSARGAGRSLVSFARIVSLPRLASFARLSFISSDHSFRFFPFRLLVSFTSPPSRFFSSYLVFLRPLVRFIYFVSFGRFVHLASFRCFRSYLGSFVRSLVSVISVRLIVSCTPSPSRFFRSYIDSSAARSFRLLSLARFNPRFFRSYLVYFD